jgi:hypothetical protein
MSGQFLAHLTGDYLLQSHWMAQNKTRDNLPAAVHAVTYALPFLVLTRDPRRLAVIAGSHFVIDRWRLARHVCWAKNNLAPPGSNPPWEECKATGYPPDAPDWMAVWLMIVADNTMHGLCNWLALRGE